MRPGQRKGEQANGVRDAALSLHRLPDQIAGAQRKPLIFSHPQDASLKLGRD